MKNLTFTIALLLPLRLAAQVDFPEFIIPIQGTHLQDFYVVNYVDWSFGGIQDHHCGNKTYDGHQGTDFVLRNFAQMDAGVDVYAAGAGVVTYVLDTLFDRNKTAVAGGLGNYVAVRHFNDFYSYYGHLKKGSGTVQVGDTVAAGQKIGQVGSSGYTSDPHLHFEVWYDSLFVHDPFAGPCGNAESLWLDTLPYVGEFGVIDHDFTHFVPTLDTLKERLPGQSAFSSADAVVTFWMQGYGVFPGDVSTVRWFDPEGNLWFQFEYEHLYEWWYYYFWAYINAPPANKSGQWTVQYLVNDELKIADTFTVLGPSSLTEHATAADAKAFQNADGDLVLQWQQGVPLEDEICIVDMLGVPVYSGKVSSPAQMVVLPVSKMLAPGVYVLYSRHGRVKPLRFVFAR
ncbi:MAG: M23 family metallopeptidase [Saprospiraceae bacterium]